MCSVKADVDANEDLEVEATSHLLLSTRGAALLARDMTFSSLDQILRKIAGSEWGRRAAN